MVGRKLRSNGGFILDTVLGNSFFLVRNLNKEVRQWNAWRVWLGVTGGGWKWTPRDPVRNKCMDYTDNNLEGKAYVWLITEILMSVLSFFVWGEGSRIL